MAEIPPVVGWPYPQILNELSGGGEKLLFDRRIGARMQPGSQGRAEPAPIEPTLEILLRVFDTEPHVPKRVKSEDEKRAEKIRCEALGTSSIAANWRQATDL